MESQESHSAVALSTSQSWALLRESVVGRLAVLVDDEPDIFPINYIIDHGSIVFRTAEGTKLTASVGCKVAFEIDSYEPQSGRAWSVVVKGMAQEITRLHDVLDALALPLFPWHASAKARIVRIEPEQIAGRRFQSVREHPKDDPATPAKRPE